MFLPMALILGVLWLLGLVNGYTLGGFIHILVVMAIVLVGLNFHLGGRKV
jgi:hypothetical protein